MENSIVFVNRYAERIWYIIIVIMIAFSPSSAINPILPITMFIPDVEAHKWADGKIYLYGSHDISNSGTWCSTNYHVFSSSDLISWTDHGESFRSATPNDQVPWSDAILYAPDCAYSNGKYFLYFCLADFSAEGVATSTSPVGPFTSGIKIAGASSIDPGVFVDDDGQAYLYWGQYHAFAAKLKSNMMEIDQTTIKDSVIFESKHHFHEASSMHKRDGIYYYVYADISRGKPTALGYSTGPSPFGPFTYKGIIIDNSGCDPSTWNNHGSIQEFNGKWYVFYHRSSRNSQFARRVCAEPISFNPDGTIPEVPMTSQGVEGPIGATKKIEAEIACGLSGAARIQDCSEGTDAIDSIQNGNYAVYRNLDFGAGVTGFQARAMASGASAKIEIRLESETGPLVGTCPIAAATAWTTYSCSVSGATGVHAVHLKFINTVTRLNWFTFTPSVTLISHVAENPFNGLTELTVNNSTIRFSIPRLQTTQRLKLIITDTRGKTKKMLFNGITQGGEYTIALEGHRGTGGNGRDHSGLFLLTLQCGQFVKTMKIFR